MDSNNNGIAVIGMAGRFPGANNMEQFWENLLEGKDSITHFTDEEVAPYIANFGQVKNNPDYVKARGILENIEWFDAAFFGISPNEAKTMDPQHKLWFETVWEALENAACDPERVKGAIGVFAGTLQNSYLQNYILKDEESRNLYNSTYSMEAFQLLINNDPGFLPTKTAYKFNLRGPAINVQCACSTSLVAIAQACQSLFNFESDICIAGGISISLPQETGYLYQKGAITSSDGTCRPFDKESSGTVASNGVGVVILKRLEDALADHDHIYSVIKGWATNNDGNRKVSFMAPSVEGQSEVIRMAQAIAEIHPEDIGYVETHGTATPLGDPIEIAGLTKAFGEKTDKKQYCAIGSVKSNIGHVDVAAGVAGFIKSSLIAYHKTIPASIHFTTPNPNIDFTQTPFYIEKEKTDWTLGKPLNIGISSFGIGGTNAHVIIQEPPAKKIRGYKQERPHLVVLSAKSEFSIGSRKKDLLGFLKNNKGINFHEFVSTLQAGRKDMPFKSFAVAGRAETLLADSALNNFIDSFSPAGNKPVVFMFPGQGAQYVNMGRELYEKEPLCRPVFDTCFSIFKNETGVDLKEIIFQDEANEESERRLANTGFTQPALFIIEYAVSVFLRFFGIKPEILIGHSIGEYAAACLAGVFSLEDGLKAVVKRGQLMQKMPGGTMLAVKTNLNSLKQIKDAPFEIAAVNAPDLTVVSVEHKNLEVVAESLKQNSFEYIHLNTSHAFHSAAFDPILDEFAEYIGTFTLNAPEIPFISCLTGERITPQMATDPKYWAQQLRNPVQFAKGISTIAEISGSVFLEVGPNTHLTSLVRRNGETTKKTVIIPTLGKPAGQDEQFKMVGTLGRLWASGVQVDFNQFYPEKPDKIVLPTYPFDRKKFWIDWAPPVNGDSTAQKLSLNEKIHKADSDESEVQETNPDKTTLFTLKEMLINLTGFDPEMANPSVAFSDLGMESLFLTQFAQRIEKKFKLKIEFRQIVHDYNNLQKLSAYIDDNTTPQEKQEKSILKPGQEDFKNFVAFKPEGENIPLIFLHGDNCNHFLPEQIGEGQPYLGFLHLGSDGEKYGFKRVEELADFYLGQLLRYRPNDPYILGGHSFGGIIAYEMAARLKKKGMEVPLLILSDSVLIRRLPLLALKHGIKARIKDWAKRNYCDLIHTFNRPLPVNLRNFYILDNYDELASSYNPPKYTGRVLLLKASKNEFTGKILNWDQFAPDLSVVELEGGHNEIINDPETIVKYTRAIQSELAKVLVSPTYEKK